MDLSIWITLSIISFLWNIKTNVNSEGYKTGNYIDYYIYLNYSLSTSAAIPIIHIAQYT